MIILSGNTDFGEQIGRRIIPITKILDNFKVFCRGVNKNKFPDENVQSVFPGLSLIMKSLTAIEIYLTKKFPIYEIRMYLYQKFLIRKLKNIDLSQIKIFHSWDYTPEVYKYLKNNNPKIKIIQDVAIALPIILNDLKNKEIFGEEKFETKKIVLNSFPFIDKFIVPSEFVKESLLLEKIKKEKIEIVPFGVDLNNYKPIENKKDKFRVAFAGNVNNRKGIKYLIEAWKKKFTPNMELHIYGRVYPEVLKYFKDKKKYNIVLHGYVNLTDELPKNHVFAFPSLMEGSAKAVYEAMACGLVIVTTKNSGSIIENNTDGYIIDTENSRQLAEKIDKLKNEYKTREKIRNNSLEKIKKYTWRNYAKNVKKIYEEITLYP